MKNWLFTWLPSKNLLMKRSSKTKHNEKICESLKMQIFIFELFLEDSQLS